MPGRSALEREFQLRLSAFDWLRHFGSGYEFNFQELAGFTFEGRRVPLLDYTRGIRKPHDMAAALSIRTVFTPPGAIPPYADDAGDDGLLRYKMRGTDPNHPENVGLRTAMQTQSPLVWFLGVSSGRYLARYPVYLVGEERERHEFVIALDEMQLHTWTPQGHTDDQRRYAEQLAQRRIHQPLFRARVLKAYDSRCAMCRLRHAPLLDASHIVGDRHALGLPIVPNGLALCKIHHAAFDHDIIGVSPDLVIAVRRDILGEVDGPMLRHGLQELNGVPISAPREKAARPDPERLSIRYEKFLAAVA